MNWKPGDLAIIHSMRVNVELNGIITTIIEIDYDTDRDGTWYLCTGLNDEPGLIQPRNLKPLPPDDTVTTWDECIFKPKILERVESG